MTSKIESLYLDNPATTLPDKAKNVAIAFVLNMVYIQFIILFLNWLFDAGYKYEITSVLQFGPPNLKLEFFMACIAAPLFEELLFRVSPFGFAKNWGRSFFIPVFIVSQMVFGYMHGQWTISLLIQGTGGCFLAWCYLRNGYCYWSSVAMHAMWNTYWTLIA